MDIANLDLNLLRALHALLQERSVTKAGERIGIGQSGMSSAVSRLRVALGDPIIVRVGRNYELTEFALSLNGSVSEILRLVEETFARRTFDPSTDRRTFVVAASDYSTFVALEPFVNKMAAQDYLVTLKIIPASLGTVRLVESRDIDLLLWAPNRTPKLASEVLVIDRWVCAAWTKHPCVRDGLTLEQYLSWPHVRRSADGTETEPDRIADSYPTARTIKVETSTFSTVPFLLEGTNMLSVIPERLGRRFARAADIRLLELPFDVVPIEQTMYWHPGLTTDRAHTWLRSSLKDAILPV